VELTLLVPLLLAITPLFCPGISMAQVCTRLGIANFFMVLCSYVSVDALVAAALITKWDVVSTLATFMGVLVVLFTLRIRFRMRYLFSIPGSLIEDMFTTVFCCCCSVAQMAAHSESFEINTLAVLPRATLPGYTFG
jgi:Cys-rich protein (TIGR01571 family)